MNPSRSIARSLRLLAPHPPAARPRLPPQLPPSPARPLTTSSTRLAGYRRFGDSQRAPIRLDSRSPVPSQGTPLFGNSSNPILSRFRRPPAIVYVLLGGGGIYYLFHLEQVERTGRWRFMDVSKASETEMGRQGFAEVMGEYRNKVLPKNHPTSRYVQSVVRRIVESNGLEAGPEGWETFVVADDETRNAFVLPGSKIFVFSGILPIAQDADGLSIILGHEIAHQVARHSAERMSSMKVLFALSLLLESLGIDVGISRVLLNLVMTLPNSRKNESEADFIGLQLANAACFDPRSATGLWQRMGGAEGGGGKKGGVNVDFLSTHPASGKRVEKVTEWAEEIIRDRPNSCGPLERQAGAFKTAARGLW